MRPVLDRTARVWLLLMAATGVSWYFGVGGQADAVGAHAGATVGIMLIALVKVRLVMSHFMEVRSAPVALRLLCDAWIVAIGAVILGFYWSGLQR